MLAELCRIGKHRGPPSASLAPEQERVVIRGTREHGTEGFRLFRMHQSPDFSGRFRLMCEIFRK